MSPSQLKAFHKKLVASCDHALDQHGAPTTEQFGRMLAGFSVGLSISTVADLVPISRERITGWVTKDKTGAMALAIAQCKGEVRSMVCQKLLDKIHEGDLKAIVFWLSRRTEEFGDNPAGAVEAIKADESYL